MDSCSVKKWYMGMLLLDKQNDFCTALYNSLRPCGIELLDYPQVFRSRAIANITKTEFLIYYTMYNFSVFF